MEDRERLELGDKARIASVIIGARDTDFCKIIESYFVDRLEKIVEAGFHGKVENLFGQQERHNEVMIFLGWLKETVETGKEAGKKLEEER